MVERCPKCGAKVWFTNDVCPNCREHCPARAPAPPPEAEKDEPKTETPVSRSPEERRRLMQRAVDGALVLMAAGIVSLPLGMSTFWMDRQTPFYLPLLVVGGGICASPVVLLRLCAGWRVRDLVAAIVLAETVLGAGLSIWMLNLLFGIHGMCGPNLHFILGIPLLGVTVMAIPSLVGLAVSQALAVLVRHTPSWRSATRRVPAAAIVGIGLAIIYVILLAVKMNTRIFLGR